VERARDVDVSDAVKAHFDHVGHGGITRAAQVGHRLARHGFAQQRTAHKQKRLFNRLAEEAFARC
jgi:hypothetical protein